MIKVFAKLMASKGNYGPFTLKYHSKKKKRLIAWSTNIKHCLIWSRPIFKFREKWKTHEIN